MLPVNFVNESGSPRGSPVSQQGRRNQDWIAIRIGRAFSRDIFGTSCRRGGFSPSRSGISAGIFGREALLEALILSRRLAGTGASGEQSKAEQAGNEFDFHGWL